MIHSLSGGSLQKVKYANFAKVEILEGLQKGDKFWYVCCGGEQVGDEVVVPLGITNKAVSAKVLRIDKNVSSQVSPVPFSKAKQIIKIKQ